MTILSGQRFHTSAHWQNIERAKSANSGSSCLEGSELVYCEMGDLGGFPLILMAFPLSSSATYCEMKNAVCARFDADEYYWLHTHGTILSI